MTTTMSGSTKRPKAKPRKTNRIWIPILVILLIAAGGAGYYYWNHTQQVKAAAAAATPTLRTATVRRGSISVSVTGSGVLNAGQNNPMTFSTAGTVAKLTVQIGDVVKQGQVLAQLDNLDQLQATVVSAQQDLLSAQQTLDTYKQSASANIANAQIAVINDKKAVTDAQSALIKPGMVRCDQNTLDAYYTKYTSLKSQLDALGTGGPTNSDYYLKTVVPMKNQVARAYAAYQWCTGFTQYELDSSQARLALAQARLQQDQTTLNTLQKNNGMDPITLAQDENKVANAQAALDTAKANLDGATLKAPFDGTVLTVNGTVGSQVTASTAFITVADLAHPQVQFSIDETDMGNLAMGEQANVVFDPYPNQTFTGKVTQINPSLVSSNNVQAAQGQIQLDLSKEKNVPTLAQGMTGTVTLIKAQANNVLLAPVQALRDLGDGTYGVFVVDSSGQPKLKIVTIGLQDLSNVEIKSGLNAGDVVSTGTSQIRQPASNQSQ